MTAVGRAPGRLDVLGGVSDYSGGLVLQMPLHVETTVCVRRTARGFRVASTRFGEFWEPGSLDEALCRAPRWARYVLGGVRVLGEATGWTPDHGLSFAIESDVPASVGVASSAALEVATLRALVELSDRALEGRTQIAQLARRVENEVVGAPCGIMDQLASAFGRPGELLPIVCRPDRLLDHVPLPTGVTAVGWPSNVTHDVSGAPYMRARTAAFMAKRLLELRHGRSCEYLTEMAGLDDVSSDLPERLQGRDFLDMGDRVDDPLSMVELDIEYPVRAAARFALEEHARCSRALDLIAEGRIDELGALMRLSHEGYGAMGLGAPETDRMVDEAYGLGASHGVYGARVSGGGSGGTVVVLLEERAVDGLRGSVIR